jgi:hypothetical protein
MRITIIAGIKVADRGFLKAQEKAMEMNPITIRSNRPNRR